MATATTIATSADLSSQSPSATLMELTDVDHMSDFDQVTAFLSRNLDKVINEVHGLDKLLLDNGKTQLNCPPKAEKGDSHGSLLIRTLSEKEGSGGITLKREFKVHVVGAGSDGKQEIEVREDVVAASPNGPVNKENRTTLAVVRE